MRGVGHFFSSPKGSKISFSLIVGRLRVEGERNVEKKKEEQKLLLVSFAREGLCFG